MQRDLSPILASDRLSVRALHQAYADKIESFYRGLKKCPGDPFDVRIRGFGSARTAIARGHDWLNRATLTGDEDLPLVDEIIEYFQTQRERCHVEWNPGNCYRSGGWNDELGRHLLSRGFKPGGFRCVWAAELEPGSMVSEQPSGENVRSFDASQVDEFLEIVESMDNQPEVERVPARLDVKYGEGDAHWRHYVGYLDGKPCGNCTLFMGERIAYLEWGRTLEAARGRGLHASMIRRRMEDARAAGCDAVFAVTDIGIPSARNLQRAGFRLAYNYVMLVRVEEAGVAGPSAY